jgi:hypothetical protein
MVDLPRALPLLVDRRDLDRENEANGAAAGGRKRCHDLPVEVLAQLEQARLRGNELLGQLVVPAGVREVPGCHHLDPLATRPLGQVLEVAVPARRAGELRVDVEVGKEAALSHHLGT